MHKRLLYIVLIVGLSLSLSPSLYAQSAPTVVATGNCGDQEPSYDGCVHLCDQPSATWTLYSDSTLVIEGTGRNYVSLDDLKERDLASRDPKRFLQVHRPPVLIDEELVSEGLWLSSPFLRI